MIALALAGLLGSWSVWLLFDRASEPVVGWAARPQHGRRSRFWLWRRSCWCTVRWHGAGEERARRAVFDERARIAREMHDIVAHALSVVISQADGGRYAARAEPEAAVEALATIARTGRQALLIERGYRA